MGERGVAGDQFVEARDNGDVDRTLSGQRARVEGVALSVVKARVGPSQAAPFLECGGVAIAHQHSHIELGAGGQQVDQVAGRAAGHVE